MIVINKVVHMYDYMIIQITGIYNRNLMISKMNYEKTLLEIYISHGACCTKTALVLYSLKVTFMFCNPLPTLLQLLMSFIKYNALH